MKLKKNPQEKDKTQIMLHDTCIKKEIMLQLPKNVGQMKFGSLAHKINLTQTLVSGPPMTYLSRSITNSQCGVCGKRSTAIAFTGWNASEMGIDLALCRAKPALLMFLHPLLSLFPFSIFTGDGVQSSIAFATKVSGLQDM